MKTTLQTFFLFTLALGSFPILAEPPKAPEGCWTDNPKTYIVDGSFSVYVKTGDISKEELLARMRTIMLQSNLQPTYFPSVSEDGGTMAFTLTAGNKERNESRDSFQKRVNDIVRTYQSWRGFTLHCSTRAIPHPSTTGSN